MGVSVVIATYNGERFLAEQLNSVVLQSAPPDEVIIADDGSLDKTPDIVRQYQRQMPLFYMPSEGYRLGPAKNFERAVKRSSCEFIAFADQDDIWQKTRLEEQVSILRDNPDIVLVHSNATLIDAVGRPAGDLFSALRITEKMLAHINAGRAFDILLKRNVVTGATTMTRRDFALSTLPIPRGWLHDEWFAICSGGRIRVLDRRLIQYRQHNQNHIGAPVAGLKSKFTKLFENAHERNARLLLRAESLLKFALRQPESAFFDSNEINLIQQKFAHEKFRNALRKSRFMRVVPILRNIRGYRRFGNACVDIARDMLQPRQGKN